MTETFHFIHFRGDLYSGPNVGCEDSEDEEFSDSTSSPCENSVKIELELPVKKKYKSIIIEYDDHDNRVILEKEFRRRKNAKKFLLQAYCKFNGHTPFICTGSTSSYKEKGHYGPKIDITSKRINKYDEDAYDHEFMFGVILDESNVIKTLSIKPRE